MGILRPGLNQCGPSLRLTSGSPLGDFWGAWPCVSASQHHRRSPVLPTVGACLLVYAVCAVGFHWVVEPTLANNPVAPAATTVVQSTEAAFAARAGFGGAGSRLAATPAASTAAARGTAAAPKAAAPKAAAVAPAAAPKAPAAAGSRPSRPHRPPAVAAAPVAAPALAAGTTAAALYRQQTAGSTSTATMAVEPAEAPAAVAATDTAETPPLPRNRRSRPASAWRATEPGSRRTSLTSSRAAASTTLGPTTTAIGPPGPTTGTAFARSSSPEG